MGYFIWLGGKVYVIDTDIVVNFLRDKEKRILIYNIYTKKIYITFVTLSELFFGAYNSQNQTKHFDEIYILTNLVDILYPDFNTGKLFGSIKKELRDLGKVVGDLDIMIAAITINNNFELITNNAKHYSSIKNLKLANLDTLGKNLFK